MTFDYPVLLQTTLQYILFKVKILFFEIAKFQQKSLLMQKPRLSHI